MHLQTQITLEEVMYIKTASQWLHMSLNVRNK